MYNPKRSNYISANNQLICSEIFFPKEVNKEREIKAQKSRLYHFEKEKEA
jgi:hypothetical protein